MNHFHLPQRWVVTAVLAAAGVLLCVRPASAAAASAASVDQVLAALAEVVKDRAKVVAAQTIKNQIKGELCGKEIVVPRAPKPLTIKLGGATTCQPMDNCHNAFVDSCQVLGLGAALTDTQFLRLLARETVRFGFRVALAARSEEEYDRLGFDYFAVFVYETMENLSRDGASSTDLVDPLLELAANLDQDLARDALSEIGALPETKALIEKLHALRGEACTAASGHVGVASTCVGPAGSGWELMRAVYADSAACQAFFSKDREQGGAYFKAFFSGDRERAAKKGCDTLAEGDQKACHAMMLATGLFPPVAKAFCGAQSTDGDRDLRNLLHVVSSAQEQKMYAQALDKHSTAPPGTADAFKAWLSKARGKIRTFKTRLVHHEIAAALRVIAQFLRARAEDPAATRTWIAELKADLARTTPDDAAAIFEGKSLGWRHRDEWGRAILPLRDAVAHLTVLPRLQLVLVEAESRPTDVKKIQAVRDALNAIVRALSQAIALVEKEDRPTAGDALRRLRRLLAAEADVLRAVANVGDAADADTVKDLATIMDEATEAVAHAEDRDWVGLALQVSGSVQKRLDKTEKFGEISRSLAFSRLLLGAYQAKSKEDAKAIFEGALEEVSSREQRYERGTVDIGALMAAGGGYMRRDGENLGTYGLYAPFGVQFACKGIGGFVYPIDLGAYLFAAGKNPDSPEPSEALRGGVAIFGRPSASIPIVLGVGGDYRPPLDSDPSEWRATGFLALELPLYMIH